MEGKQVKGTQHNKRDRQRVLVIDTDCMRHAGCVGSETGPTVVTFLVGTALRPPAGIALDPSLHQAPGVHTLPPCNTAKDNHTTYRQLLTWGIKKPCRIYFKNSKHPIMSD